MVIRQPIKRVTSAAIVLALLFAVSSLWSGPNPVSAVIRLTVSPAILPLEATPGATGAPTITLLNEGDEPVDIVTAVEPYLGASGEYSAVDWLQIEPATFSLDVGESRDVVVHVNVPNDIASGGRYALVTFTTGGGEAGEGSGAGIAGKLGAAVYVVVDGDGDLVESADLIEFGPVLESDGRVGFRAHVVNTGNVHLRPAGVVEVLEEDGSPYGSLEIPVSQTVLPGQEGLLPSHGSMPMDQETTYSSNVVVALSENESLTGERSFSPTAELAIESADVCENLDRGPTMTATLGNSGGLGLFPLVRYTVRTASGDLLGDVLATESVLVWGGETGVVSQNFPERLVSGDYTLLVSVLPAPPDQEGQLLLPELELEQPFSIGGLSGDAVPLCESAGDTG